MTKFIMKDMFDTMTTYPGPSGTRYTINQGIPFEVQNKMDVDFFRSDKMKKRFKEVGIFTKVEPPKDDITNFEIELRKIKKISEKTILKVLDTYTRETLTQAVLERHDLDPEISKTQQDILIKYIESKQFPESAEEQKSDEDKKTDNTKPADVAVEEKEAKEEVKEEEEAKEEALESTEETKQEINNNKKDGDVK